MGERVYSKRVLVGKPERKGKLGREDVFEEGLVGRPERKGKLGRPNRRW